MVVQVDVATLDELRAAANEKRTTIGEILRAALGDYLGRRDGGDL